MQAQAPDQLYDHEVVDSAGSRIGKVDGVWVDDATNELEFVGVKTGWLMGKTHIVPAVQAQIDGGSQTVTVPYSESQIKDAPSFGADAELSLDAENEIYSYYGIERSTAPSPTGLPSGEQTGTYDTNTYETAEAGERRVQLAEEELQVGKRPVEAGRVRLRKVVRTEQQEVPVELRREDVNIERVPASGQAPSDTAFQEETIEVPVTREEPVVAKEAQVTGEVRIDKTAETETQTVGGEVRREDVEVERDVDAETAIRDRGGDRF